MARILVVEDDGALRNDIADKLSDWGHEVQTAGDGHHGFEVIETWQPDLVLSDINMPRESGIDLITRITKLDLKYADMAFIFISSLSTSTAIVDGINCGADDYITKPIDYDLLRTKINSHIRKQQKVSNKLSLDQTAISMEGAMLNGVMLASVFGVCGVAVLFVVYWIKTVIGINIFQDAHLSDVFSR